VSTPRWIGADEVSRALSFVECTDVLERALRDGLDPSLGPARTGTPLDLGELLVMPSQGLGFAGAKLVTVSPENPARGLPTIQGVFVLLAGASGEVLAVIDAPALTSLRTPAVSALAARHLCHRTGGSLVVFGAGPQAHGHVHALLATVEGIDDVVVVSPRNAGALVRELRDEGVEAREGRVADVADAGIVVCATSAGRPLFPGELVADDAVVLAVGSHHPARRELDGGLLGRSSVVVEDVATAQREAGDVVMAVAEGFLSWSHVVGLAGLVRGSDPVTGAGPRLFKGVGMAWQDLVTAAEVFRRVS